MPFPLAAVVIATALALTASIVVPAAMMLFASSNDLCTRFRSAEDPQHVILDMSRAHIRGASTVASLDSIREKHERHGTGAISWA